LTGLLVLCCAIAGVVSVMYVQTDVAETDDRLMTAAQRATTCGTLFPVGSASAGTAETLQKSSPVPSQPSQSLSTVGSWGTTTVRSVGTFFASLYAGVRDFFVSGQALKGPETATQAIEDFAVRLFAPLASAVLSLLQRAFPEISVTRELVAVWIFWIIVVLLLLVLVLLLRPRRTSHGRLPKASPRVAGQGGNAIEFGLVEQGPAPEPAVVSKQPVDDQATTTQQDEPPTATESVTPEPTSSVAAGSPSIPEISLEPLGFFGSEGVTPEERATPPAIESPPSTVMAPPIVELASAVTEPVPSPEVSETTGTPTFEAPSEALLETPAVEPQSLEPVVEAPPASFAEPDLTPIGQTIPVQSEGSTETTVEPEASAESLSEPLVKSEPVAEDLPVTAEPETFTAEAETQAGCPLEETTETPADVQAAQPTPSSAGLLSHMLEEEGAFQKAVATAGTTEPVAAASGVSAPEPAAEPSIFAGDVDLDALIQEGVVSDATALGQLFGGGYRSEISKLAISAKDLQNVPEEIRSVVKLTIVALSPIELSIARDVAMRLEAPGFVGEALLVAKKMGYQNYLTTYKNISRNYKDVSIVETASLKAPHAGNPDSGEELISFS